MKKIIFNQLVLLLMVPFLFLACDKDDKEPVELVPELSGLYVYGTNTVASTAVEPNAKMNRAILNPDKSGGDENREGVYGKLMYIGANSTIQFMLVEDEVSTKLGIPDGGGNIAGADLPNTDVIDSIIIGTLTEDSNPVQIADEGLYYLFANLDTYELRIMRVLAEIIGDATEAQWTAGTPIPQIHVSVDSAVFEVTELPLVGASGYKYRFNNGWELYNDGDMATYTHLGVESYGDAWDSGINDIGYFGENIPHKEDGVFTIRLKYTASTGEWEETKTKTGILLIDYTYNEMGMFGNAYTLASGDTANWVSGSDGYGLHAPSKSGNVYTWTWDDVNLIQDREFIFLENGAWGGLQFDWAMLSSVGGQAVDDGKIVDATTLGGEWHNFYVVEGGLYDITLVIDAATETKTVTIVSAS